MNNDEKKIASYSLLQMKLGEVKKTKKAVTPKTSAVKDSDSDQVQILPSSDIPAMKKVSTPSTLPKFAEAKIISPPEEEPNPDIPDRSYGDYYCKICDSHMNSENMWEAHISGKKHMKNIKKGDIDSKYDDLDVESNVKDELKDVKEPIVGLSYIHEIRRLEPNVPPVYNCFLCHASIATIPLVKEHVCTLKHRLNYIKESTPEEFELLNATNLKKASLEPLVVEAVAKLEGEFGRGDVKVKQVKAKPGPPTTYKRAHEDDKKTYDDHKRTYNDDRDQDHRPLPKPQKFNFVDFQRDNQVWKSIEYPKIYSKYEESSRSKFENKVPTLGSKDYSPMKEFRKNRRSRSPSYTSPSCDPYYKKVEHSRRYDSDKYDRRSDTESRFSRRSPPDDYDLYSKREESFHSKREESFHSHRSAAADLITKHYPGKRSVSSERSHTSYDVPLPSKGDHSKEFNISEIQKHLLEAINGFPTDSFLTFVLRKMDHLELKDINQLSLLTQICNKAHSLICSKFPPNIQDILKQRLNLPDQVSKPPSFENKGLADILASIQKPSNLNPFSQSPISKPGILKNSSSSTSITNSADDLLYGTSNSSLKPASSYQGNLTKPEYPNQVDSYYSNPYQPAASQISYPSPANYQQSTAQSNIPGLTLADNTFDSFASRNTWAPPNNNQNNTSFYRY